MDIVSIIFGLAFCVAGALFAAGRLHIYLQAWKRMSPEEKEQIRIGPLSRNIGEMIGLAGIIFLINGLWPGFQDHWFAGAMVAWLVISGIDLWVIEKSHRYEKGGKDE